MLVRPFGSTDGGKTWKPVKVDSDGGLQVDVLSIAGGSLLFKYEAQVCERVADRDVAAGDHYIYSSAVASGKIWVITSALVVCAGSSPTRADLGIYDGTYWTENNRKLSPADNEFVVNNGNMVLAAGDKVFGYVVGAGLNDDLFLRINGYQIVA